MNGKLLRAALLVSLTAAAPVQAAEATKGEIALHIEATATAAPDAALVLLRIEGSGATEEAARAALDAPRAAMFSKLAELGVDEKDRRKLPETVNASVIEAVEAAAAVVPADEATPRKRRRNQQESALPPPRSEFYANEEWQVTLRKPEALLQLKTLDESQVHVLPIEGAGPIYLDPAKARDGAIAKAIANAREDADRYANALGYRVVRIERVSNAKPALNMPDIINTFMMMDKRSTREAMLQQGSMTVGVAIDFAIAPK